ncbi:MAG: DUF4091 domain-containing protein, partial [Ruminococcaceae bacterium]|nr:DUF4091 domain-containing protein [Oscillospiraceae bacterium]
MKKLTKISFLCLIVAAFIAICAQGSIAAQTASCDPADSYIKQAAPYEDPGIELWFEHSFKKVLTEDITPSGMDTYSVYMAKNEIESAQFVLCSDETKSGMTATVSDFVNTNGDVIPAEIYYQMYITVTDLVDNNIFGATSAEDDFIREGEIPDPVAPLANVSGGVFQLNAGKSQAFYIRIKSDETTPAGWYSAQLDIKNANGQIVKTAKVYTYVWNFTISEKTALQTSFILTNNTSYGGTYEEFYNYLLENRLCATDIPGTVSSTNPYLTNDRVSAVRVNATGGGNKGTYSDGLYDNNYYKDIYNDLKTSDIWEEIEDKLYFYNIDEPLPGDLLDISNVDRHDVDDAHASKLLLESNWGGHVNNVIPHGEEHYYPYSYYSGPIASYPVSKLHSATQEMIDEELCTIWCPRMYGFTPSSEIAKLNYSGVETSIIRNMSGPYSGNPFAGELYYDWESIYGDFSQRVLSQMAIANSNGEEKIKLWAYSAGMNKGYSYTNHLIENTGLQTKLLFWQLYQEDCTGYLYYGSNNWSEYDTYNNAYYDTTPTGAKTNCQWKVNKYPLPASSHVGSYIYGNGVLFYGRVQGKMQGIPCIGSIRVEMMRDGVEEYQMLSMLEELLGKDCAKEIVAKVSTNVVNYLSMPAFSTDAWDSSMDEYDIMAEVRKDLGNTLEKAIAAPRCSHSYEKSAVTKKATCLEIGYEQYVCTKCSATESRVIPALHTEGSCFETVAKTDATCTADGYQVIRCSICKYEKESVIPSYHSDSDHYSYSYANGNFHNIVCTVCNEALETKAHSFFKENTATCTESGEMLEACKFCGHTKVLSKTEARGHYLKEAYIAPT